MLRRKRPLTRVQIEEAWKSDRSARVAMRLLVQAEFEQVRIGYADLVEPLHGAYKETGNPGLASLAIQPLEPTALSRRGLGRSLHYAHAARWSVEALLAALDVAYPSHRKDAEQWWLAREHATASELEGIKTLLPSETRRVLAVWFGAGQSRRS